MSATSTRRTAGRPIQWTMRERKDWRSSTLSNPVPRFRRRNGNGKNADSQGDRVESLTVPGWAYRKKMTESHRPEWYWQRLSTIRTISVLSVPLFFFGKYFSIRKCTCPYLVRCPVPYCPQIQYNPRRIQLTLFLQILQFHSDIRSVYKRLHADRETGC